MRFPLGFRLCSHLLIRLSAIAAIPIVFAQAANAASLPDFTDLIERSQAAVVNISIDRERRSGRNFPEGFDIPELPPDSPFNDFFRRFFKENGDMQGFGTTAFGSGFIISEDGYIISNHHVIRDAGDVIVRLSDRREFDAEIVGSDERSDIALLKIDATGLPSVRIGTDYDLEVGEWVLAIGSPFGFHYSATAGIVSAKSRSLQGENYVPFIQTDVAINPGNSGGPLFNLQGEVVGVNAQIYSRTGSFMGLSFAIPIDVAMDVVNQLREKGRVSRGWLGVHVQDLTRELAESFGMDKPKGALVSRVLDGPARKGGVLTGDIILAFNEKEIDRSSDLPPVVGLTRVGEEAKVDILRDGEEITLMVELGELPDDDMLQSSGRREADIDRIGISVRDLNEEELSAEDGPGHGVVVIKVEEGIAQRAGLRAGDVIKTFKNEKIESAVDFKRIVAALESGKAVSMLVQRNGDPVFLALRPE